MAKADYVNDLRENTRLEMGVKLTSMHFMNDVLVQERAGQAAWQNIPSLTSVSQMKETVAGAYLSFSTKLDDKTDLKAGLRYEHTDTRLDSGEAVVIVDRNYGSWFPTVFLTRKISETQALNLSYSRRISRPKISQLAPFLIFSDPTTLVSGNPALQPAFTDAFSLSYTLKTWRLGISYSIEKAPQGFIPKIDARTNQQIITFGNLGQQKTWSANLYVPIQLADWWEISNNVYVNSVTLDFELEGRPIKVKNLAYGFSSNHSFKLPKQFSLEVSGNFDSPTYWGIAFWQATGSLNIGVEKNFGDKWGKVRLNVSDIFLSTNWYGITEQPEIGMLTKQSFQFAERVFMLSWTNTFGNKKLKAARQRKTGASEEWRRI